MIHRPIKYKAMLASQKEWAYGTSIVPHGDGQSSQSYLDGQLVDMDTLCVEVPKVEDRFGQQVYIGDILHFDGGLFMVDYFPSAASFMPTPIVPSQTYAFLFPRMDFFTVVGNRYSYSLLFSGITKNTQSPCYGYRLSLSFGGSYYIDSDYFGSMVCVDKSSIRLFYQMSWYDLLSTEDDNSERFVFGNGDNKELVWNQELGLRKYDVPV